MRPIVRNYIILVAITLLSAGSTAIAQDINNYKFSGTFEPADGGYITMRGHPISLLKIM